MSRLKLLALALFLPLLGLTIWAAMDVGLLGILGGAFDTSGSTQIFFDLVVALVLVVSWMVRDARKKGRNVIPYIVLTLAAGSFGPLLYLLLAPSSSDG